MFTVISLGGGRKGGRFASATLFSNVAKSLCDPRLWLISGCALLNDTIYTLTWRERTFFQHSASSLSEIEEKGRYDTTTGEGWGITPDPTRSEAFVVSDGSKYLHFCTPSTSSPPSLECPRKVEITYRGKSVRHLNELGERALVSVAFSRDAQN